MKTSQICESMKNRGKLFAFDKSPARCETLVKLGKRNGTVIF
jgi:16S rRNA C967 or C1407 C5-methylase (RsmB/RsmF family)